MIVYFADREQVVKGQASTSLPNGLIIIDDIKTEDIDTGVASFDVTIAYEEADRLTLEQMTEAGNYVFRSSGTDAECYTIIDAETNAKEKTRHLYCEDAGLDLLNILCTDFEAENQYPIAWYINHFAGDSGFEVGVNEIPDKVRILKWDGEQTGTERLRSLATQFDNAEISYRFTIENMQVTHKYIDIWQKRGTDMAQELRLNRDIDNIIVKHSVANVITALKATGETLEGEEEPLDLIGAIYDDGDIYLDTLTGILYSRKGHGRWARPNGGYITGAWTYETDSQTELLNRAVSHLRQYAEQEINYDVDIVRGLDNAHIGDRVNIVDDLGEVYVSGRILQLETSVTGAYKRATLGEYLIKTSGLSTELMQLSTEFKNMLQVNKAIAESVNVLTETVDNMFTLEVESEMGASTAHLTAHLYQGNKEITQEHSPALFKWIRRTENGEQMISRGYTLDISLEEIGYAGTILCRFIRPVLYDLTDHNLTPITDADGNNIQASYAGLYQEPVVRRARMMLRALNTVSDANEKGYPILAREVNLYEREGLNKRLDPIVQHFWTDDTGAHITEVTRDDFITNPDAGGGNLLARSDGVYLRDGLRPLADFEAGGLTIHIDDKQETGIYADGIYFGSIDRYEDCNARYGTEIVGYYDTDGNWHEGVGIHSEAISNGEYAQNRTSAGEAQLILSEYVDSNRQIKGSVHLLASNGYYVSLDENNKSFQAKAGKATLDFSDDGGLYFSHATSANASIAAYSESSGYEVELRVGAGGVNHGVFSPIAGKWIVYSDGDLSYMPLINDSVTSSAGNVFVSGTAGQLAKGSSSSKRYKKDIKNITGDLDPSKLYDIKVRQFKYKDDYLSADDPRYGKDVGGFIAEELEKVYPIAVDYRDGKVEDWNYRYLVPPMLKLIQDQKAEIDELKKRIEKLEAK